jgi:hypothetical protein
MTENVHVDHESLVSYLYDECEPAERLQVAAHLDQCAACAEEVSALGATREHLAGWAPPDIALGFRVSRPRAAGPAPAAILRPERWWSRPLPAWAQAAAALAIFGAGLAVGVAGGPGGSGEANGPPAASAPAVAVSRAVMPDADLARDVQQLRAELASLRNASSRLREPSAPQSALAPAASGDQELLQRVQGLIEASEERQRSEFTLRAAQLARDFDVQRRVDLTQINQTIGRVEGQTGAEVRQQRQALYDLGRVIATSTTGR